MENTNTDIRIGSLPGVRQGTSGAGAGRDSMRAVSGRRLNRRVTTNQHITAETPDTANTNTPHETARSVLQEIRPATTLAGRERQRMKWSDEINQQLLRCYYTVTHCETNLTGYRPELYTKFISIYPDLHNLVSQQRLADQIRVIHRNNRISPTDREKIKTEIQQVLNDQRPASNHTNHSTASNQQTSQTHEPNLNRINDEAVLTRMADNQLTNTQTSHILTYQSSSTIHTSTQLSPTPHTATQALTSTFDTETENLDTDRLQLCEQLFSEHLIKYRGTDPLSRPFLPKLKITRTSKATVNTLNQLINAELINIIQPTIEQVHDIIYCAALTATSIHNTIKRNNSNNTEERVRRRTDNKPAWERRLETKIAALRKDIGRLNQFVKENLSNRNQGNMNRIYNNKQEAIDTLDYKTQKMQALAKRLRRYKKSTKRHRDNTIFNNNQKAFYRSLNKESTIKEAPCMAEVQTFWENVWSRPTEHNSEAEWIKEELDATQHLESMPEIVIDKIDIEIAIGRTLNWKTPGPDKIHNYWLKYFTSTHEHIASAFNNFIKDPDSIPGFLTLGNTYLKPKDEDTMDPAKYRPITCLPTLYKLLTSIISQKINLHLTQNNIIAEEQKGCRKGSRGCKEQLAIDTEIHNQVKQAHRNLHFAYIDYQKAFDSVPHSWLIQVLNIYKIDSKLVAFLHHIMQRWSTVLNINTESETIRSGPIKISRGIFQGDSLSPLWFCLTLNPLSRILNKTKQGYVLHKETNTKITHLLYMDDIKLYAASKQQIKNLLKDTEIFSTDIKMNLGIDKCKINSIIKGKHHITDPYILNTQRNLQIDNMEITDTYKYLGYSQSTGLDHSKIKEELSKKYADRINRILRTELSGRNTIKAVNTYAVPVLTYSFGIIKWTTTDLDRLNRLTRTTCNKNNIHHIHSATERFNLKRKLGGRGLIDIKNLHNKQIYNIRTYMHNKANNSPLHKALTLISTSGTPLKLNDNNMILEQIVTDEQKINNWKQKSLHGKYPNQLQQEYIDIEASNAWLSKGNLYKETEGFMVAIQDQIINTKNYQKYIIKDTTVVSDKCRLCNTNQETIDHITGGCPFLANKQYTERHNNVAKQIHRLLALKYKLIDKAEPYYKYKPLNVLNNEQAKLYWDRDIITDKTTKNNRPDITLTLKEENITYLIDISIPNSENIRKKYTEKIQKYIPLADEIRQMWHQHTVKIIPIILSSTALIPKSLHTSLKELGLHKNIFIQLQKSVIIDTCSIVRRFLTSTTQAPTALHNEPTHLA